MRGFRIYSPIIKAKEENRKEPSESDFPKKVSKKIEEKWFVRSACVPPPAGTC